MTVTAAGYVLVASCRQLSGVCAGIVAPASLMLQSSLSSSTTHASKYGIFRIQSKLEVQGGADCATKTCIGQTTADTTTPSVFMYSQWNQQRGRLKERPLEAAVFGVT